jgi:hypothetical protein
MRWTKNQYMFANDYGKFLRHSILRF